MKWNESSNMIVIPYLFNVKYRKDEREDIWIHIDDSIYGVESLDKLLGILPPGPTTIR